MQSHIHHFESDVQAIPLPARFTYPFHYVPHPLCVQAAKQVQAYLSTRGDWAEELSEGKMFGVLVVKDIDGQLGFLAAFSGILAGKNMHTYFVPPVYDLLRPDGFFREEESRISAINHRVEALRTSEAYRTAQWALDEAEQQSKCELEKERTRLAEAKAARNLRRRQGSLSEEEQGRLVRESQHQKAEYKRLERRWMEKIAACRQALQQYDARLEAWRQERHRRSAALQQALFSQFRMLNAKGEAKDLCTIFQEAGRSVPPAGAGECAAPKLLQYAYLHQLHPVCMAEFWWGGSPKNELRRHGYYYPACRTKCEPILKHMLEGLEVDPNPLALPQYRESVRVVWEDDYLLVVDKPAGMLSVPGKDGQLSVWEWMRRYCPQATGPLVVHRLDMATSGLLLLAKTKEVHAALQAQFETRAVKKRYVALLDGEVSPQSGFVRLPLCPDPDNRPRQLVSEEYGKPAVTRYEVMGQDAAGHTRIALYPLTGRTHQLRVHAAHPLGLDAPIVGDALYGHAADRLYLHAEKLEFCHPVTGHWIKVEQAAMF